jgi:hypothetical protein
MPEHILASEYQRNQNLKSNKSTIMKRRVRKIANFFAFNLLFFALYLNFIHKDKQNVVGIMPTASVQQPAAFSGTTVLVDNPVQKVEETVLPAATQQVATTKEEKAQLKLSIN